MVEVGVAIIVMITATAWWIMLVMFNYLKNKLFDIDLRIRILEEDIEVTPEVIHALKNLAHKLTSADKRVE